MSGGPSNQTVSNEPPKYLRPFLTDIAGQAQNLFQTQTDFANEMEQALQLQTQRALDPNSMTGTAQAQNLATVSGDYLYGGPAFDAAYQAAANKIIPQVQSQFGVAGRSGSGLAQTAMTSALTDAFASQYGQERDRQMQATAMAPSLDLADINMLSSVGQQRQDFPWNNLQRYSSILYPQSSMGGTQTTPLYQNQGAGALGGALTAYSLFGPAALPIAAGGLLGMM